MTPVCGHVRHQRGFTLVELLTAVVVTAIVASITVPAFSAPARVAAGDAAAAFAVVLRHAQAEAQADGSRLRVALTADGSGFSISRVTPEGEWVEQRGDFERGPLFHELPGWRGGFRWAGVAAEPGYGHSPGPRAAKTGHSATGGRAAA